VAFQDSGLALDVRLRAHEATVHLLEYAQVRVGRGTLRLVSRGRRWAVTGRVGLGETKIIRDIWLPEMIARAAEGVGGGRVPAAGRRRLRYDIEVDLQQNLWVDVNLADMRLGGKVVVRGTAAEPRIEGEVEVIEGAVYYLDRRFRVSGGRLGFDETRIMNPSVNLSATAGVTAVVPRTTGVLPGTQTYTITLTVNGRLEDPQLVFTSQPPLTQPDVVSVLTLGTTLGAVGTELGERVQALAANQLLGFGARKLERTLGLEQIRITGDMAGVAVETGPHITVTKRLSRRLTLSLATAFRAINEQRVSAVYRLTRFFYLVGTTDQSGDSSIDLRFRLTW
jgi:translocation and assembly module TamB